MFLACSHTAGTIIDVRSFNLDEFDMKKVFVNCRKDGKIIASYELGYGITLGLSAAPTRQQAIEEAKVNLSNERIAIPPFAGIEFDVQYP
jgi:hypothetical protein